MSVMMAGRAGRGVLGRKFVVPVLDIRSFSWGKSKEVKQAEKQAQEAAVASALTGEQWAWKPPRTSSSGKGIEDSEVLPSKIGELLTLEEIEAALKKGGAEDVVVLPIAPKLDTIGTFVVASGTSRLHLRRLGEIFVRALKNRKLKQAPSMKGYEGGKDDDWILVDCYDTVIHLLMPSTRQAIALEKHWAPGNERPFVVDCKKEDVFEKRMDRLCDAHEVNTDYYAYWDEEETALGDSSLGIHGNVRHIGDIPSILGLDDEEEGPKNRNTIAAQRRRRAKANAMIKTISKSINEDETDADRQTEDDDDDNHDHDRR